MKNKDLFSNIQQARDHISRLKKQAEMLQSSPQDCMFHLIKAITNNMNDYMNEVIYTLNKNQKEIEKKHKEYKQKLPYIGNRKDDPPGISALKKQRNKINSTIKNSKDESTKIDDSFSLLLENRQIKMHSHHQKHQKPVQYPEQRIMSQIQISLQQSKRNGPASAQFRSRHFQQKKAIRQRDLLKISEEKKSYLKTQLKQPQTHDFQIINCSINQQTPQFASYQRIYESIFPKIQDQLNRIEVILQRQMISYAKLDGKKLAYLCLKQKVSQQQLLGCLQGLPIKSKFDKPRSIYYGKQGKSKAATLIASIWKMRSIRQKYQTLKKSTIIIQRFFKKQLLRLNLQKEIQKRNDKILHNFDMLQTRFAKSYKLVKVEKRIEIHLASVEVDQEKRLSMDYFHERQNIQLSRIFRLKDENLILIFISAVELQPQLLNYYYRIMQLAGIDNYRQRLIFMTPEHANRFPQHFSTAKLLYYSARTLGQLKIITSDLPTILYPGQPCNELLKICDYLNCFLFSGEPQKMKAFTTKSQTKRLLKNLCIETLPSAMQMYDYGQFLNTFSVLIVKNPSIQIWVLKIDDQLQGRGIAYADLGSSKYLRSILRNLENRDPQTFATEVSSDPQQQEATIRVRDYLRQHLHQKLQIATPSVYRGYTDYMGRFIKKGGLIQAHPPTLKQQLATACICFQLGPDGQHHIITSFEKINGQPYRSLACHFPQQILDPSQSASIIRQLCDSFKLRKMFGCFTIDFLVQKDINRAWVIGIDSFINDFASSFHLFDMLMNGSYLTDKNIYLVDAPSKNENQTEQSSPEERLSTRQYIFIPHLHHKNLCKVKVKEFFREARLAQFNFDVGNREGLCVLLLDQLASGVLGLLSVSSSRIQASETIKRMLDFITKISVVKNVEYGRSELQGSSDAISLKDVLSVFTGFMRKGQRQNAKQKAIRHFQMNRKLELF